jgi:hypothetical protein
MRIPSPKKAKEWETFWSDYEANKAVREDAERVAQKAAAFRPAPKVSAAKPRVSYIDAICAPLVRTLEHSAGLPVHQLAGHAANVDFWVSETKHCLAVIDGYQNRFERLRSGQAEYEMKHNVVNKAPPIQRAAKHYARQECRRSVCQAIEKFLTRCHRECLLSEKDLKNALDSVGA